ncbi:DUF397 domain-containing protein [Paractinoplanes rhizophilus]|uniref:DUF397 domain-containing protein n=1 Tax=Paractinoplanes rhizophilus TaxID=1416877 RepID=A0ABW2HIJ8_9ACTN
MNNPAQDNGVAWRISTRSGGGDCVEVAFIEDAVAFRHSRRPDGEVIRYTIPEWDAFIAGVKAGEFDDLVSRQ